MSKGIDCEIRTVNNGKQKIVVESFPDECPICHYNGVHRMLGGVRVGHTTDVEVAFQCLRQQCNALFLAYYDGENSPMCRLRRTEPTRPAKARFAKEITETSPNFAEIYNQAMVAESHGLHELTGIGLRKALEFLVKDFCCRMHPGKEDEIRAKFLGPCIDAFITDPMLKDCSKRAVWLGNDETHYVRRWEDKDITHLKELVRITVNLIDTTLVGKRLVAEMPDPKENRQ